MARGRLISRSIGSSRKFAELQTVAGKLGEFAQTLYLLLIPNSDDFGRLAGDPFTVKHAVAPTSGRKEADFAKALTAMHQVGLICWYDVNGQQVIEIQKFDEHQPNLNKRTKSKFPGNSGKFPEIPSELNRTEQNRTEKGTEQNRTVNGADAPEVVAPLTAQGLGLLWNEVAGFAGLPQCREVSGERERHAKARLAEHQGEPYWRTVIARIAGSKFCLGQNDRGWKADFDFLVRPDTHLKTLEGKYDARGSPTSAPGSKTGGNVAALQRVAQRGCA